MNEMNSYSVLFVCTANICRSPMAQGLFLAKVKDQQAVWRIASAGTYAQAGFPAAQNTLEVLRERDIDLSNHRSQWISENLMQEYRLILTMEQDHKEMLQYAFPQHANRVFLLSEMAGEYRDIEDPIGKSLYAFQETAGEIEAILTRGFERIQALAKPADVQNPL